MEVPMLCFLRSSKHRTRQLVDLTVEKVGHTTPKLGVLLGIEIATPAKNMAITHSIVKVLKKVSLMGEAEHIPKGNRKQLRQNSKPPRTVNQVNEESKPRSPLLCLDDEYTFTLNSANKVSAPFVSLKVNGVT